MSIETPDGTALYVFGSALMSPTPGDLDVLVVYDTAQVAPWAVYGRMEPVFRELRRRFGHRVHPTVLTESEAAESRFIERYRCVAADEWVAGSTATKPS